MERAISIKNERNETLFGILHLPDDNNGTTCKAAVHILNPGLKNRVAPNRLNVKIARRLTAAGYYVLRMDPSGIGDSEGCLSEENDGVMDLWRLIQKGALIKDAIAGNRYLISEFDVEEIIMIGQCGAANTAVFAGMDDDHVKKLILIDTPFRIVSSDLNISNAVIESFSIKQLMEEQAANFFKFKWIKKIFNLHWLSNKLQIVKVVSTNVVKRLFGIPPISERFHRELADNVYGFLRKGHSISFIFAANDFSLREFQNEFFPYFLSKKKRVEDKYDICIIENANHIYTEEKWQQQLIDRILFLIDQNASQSV